MLFRKKAAGKIAAFLLILNCGYIAFEMIKIHPYQNLYFNFLAGKTLKEAGEKFELDYWGLSYREGLEYILKNDTASIIYFHSSESDPAFNNLQILPSEERERLVFVSDIELANYFLTSYRHFKGPYKGKPYYTIKRNEGVVFSVYKTKSGLDTIFNDKYLLITKYSLHDGKSETDTNDHSPPALEQAEKIGSDKEYAAGIKINATSEMLKESGKKVYLKVSFRVYAQEGFNFNLVVEMDSSGSKLYNYMYGEIFSNRKNVWIKKEILFQIPEVFSLNDVVNLYAWNKRKHSFYIDQMKASLYAVPENVVHEVVRNSPIP
jgi:hypothetical protein